MTPNLLLDSTMTQTLDRLFSSGAVRRLWDKDTTLFKPDPDLAPVIRNRLGWLDCVEEFSSKTGELIDFADEVRSAGYKHVVLLGMGGSSMCPEVLVSTFGVSPGFLGLSVLDTTSPATILRIEKELPAEKTLFIVATKSGTTIETLSLMEHFWEAAADVAPWDAGKDFVAITDPGTPLERLAQERGFRRIFLNPPDIGGRYSALSYFGLVPAALLGIDLEMFMGRALKMAKVCRTAPADAGVEAVTANPGLTLGAFIGGNGLAGHDKLTLLFDPAIASMGAWLEQLIAESLGKEGKGVVPVDKEPVGEPNQYGKDRAFVEMRLAGSAASPAPAGLAAVGHPVLSIELSDKYDLASEFFRWEFATAIAGSLLQVNPFDEPNVTEAKEKTKEVLAAFQESGELPPAAAEVTSPQDHVRLRDLLHTLSPGDYLAIHAYIDATPAAEAALQKLRRLVRDRYGVATTLGWGPRFLHSTGQLHKGGPDKGCFLQIIMNYESDIEIPKQPFTFGVLQKAQAQGDLATLIAKGKRALCVDLGTDAKAGLEDLLSSAGLALAG